jgi:hypothetical protein
VTFSVAALEPADVGANFTLIVQLEPAGTELPQVFVCANWAGFVPARAMLVMDSAALPPFITVTDSGALTVFFAMLPNANDVGDSV